MNRTPSIKPNGRRGEYLHRLLNPAALGNLPEMHYWTLLQAIQDDLKSNAMGNATPHEHAFARFCLLAQSVLGSACWPGAERWLSQMTYADVAQVVCSDQTEQAFLIEIRKGLAFPILIEDSVVFALLQLIREMMIQSPLRNQGLRPISGDMPLAPAGNKDRSARWQLDYQIRLIKGYLNDAVEATGLNYYPTLAEFQASSRWLLTRIYPLDVIYALLGAVDATALPIVQLLKPGPKHFLDELNQPLRDRGHA